MQEIWRDYLASIGFIGKDIRLVYDVFRNGYDTVGVSTYIEFTDPRYLNRKSAKPVDCVHGPINYSFKYIGLDGI